MTRQEISTSIDRYLLGESRDRALLFGQIGGWQPDLPAAAPIVRAIAMIGARAADESVIALRLILAGRLTDDAAVTTLRNDARLAAKGDTAARERYITATRELTS
jgi:hypothetical protein